MASFYAFAPSFTGGVRVAVDDINGSEDIICAAGPGGGPQVTIFNGNLLASGASASAALVASFYAFAPTFTGGVFIAARHFEQRAELDRCRRRCRRRPAGRRLDGQRDPGGQPSTAPTPLTSFYAFAPSFSGGVTVALGDVTGSGNLDVICGAGPGGGPQVIVVDGTQFSTIPSTGILPSSAVLASFFAYEPSFGGGVFVATADVNGVAEIVTGAGSGGGPQIALFQGDSGALLGSFFDPRFGNSAMVSLSSGIRVGSATVNGQTEILTSAGPGSSPLVDVFNPQTFGLLDEFFAMPQGFSGGLFIAG